MGGVDRTGRQYGATCRKRHGDNTESDGTDRRCEALERVAGAIEVRTDSTYIEKCFSEGWYIRWRRDDKWRTTKGPVKNRDLWERLFALVEDDARDVSFVWLKRATEANNSVVDRLSREASKSHAEN